MKVVLWKTCWSGRAGWDNDTSACVHQACIGEADPVGHGQYVHDGAPEGASGAGIDLFSTHLQGTTLFSPHRFHDNRGPPMPQGTEPHPRVPGRVAPETDSGLPTLGRGAAHATGTPAHDEYGVVKEVGSGLRPERTSPCVEKVG